MSRYCNCLTLEDPVLHPDGGIVCGKCHRPVNWNAFGDTMTREQSHPAHQILAEIAEEARRNPEPWREFEQLILPGGHWRTCTELDMWHWLCTEPGRLRRKPRTIEINGEIDLDLWVRALAVAKGNLSGDSDDAFRFACALASFTSREDEG